jgi:hypothetical protein
MTHKGIIAMATSQPQNQTGNVGLALQAAAVDYAARHGWDVDETRERIRRPKGATPRRAKDWQ